MAQVLRLLPPAKKHPNLIVGTETFDDAGVYRLTDEIALVQTLDFFTPIVDDPFTFGQIAAANALSDVYAMGGVPITALNLVAFPKGMEKEILAEILKGGAAKMEEAGVTLVGGHTVDDPEPKYGLSVTGVVHPDKVLTNARGRAGDVLVLTKPLGVGVITTALKNVALSPEAIQGAIRAMTTLNAYAAEAIKGFEVHAATDVTGFGFLGHLYEMAAGSGVAAHVHAGAVPYLPDAKTLAAEGHVCGGSKANRRHLEPHVSWSDEIDEVDKILLTDAITSGGLLLAVAPEHADGLIEQLQKTEGVLTAARVGRLVAGEPGKITVEA